MFGSMMKPINSLQKRYFRKAWDGLKIRHKLALVFLPLPLLAVAFIGSLWYRNALHAVGETVENQTSILAWNAGLVLEDFFNKRELEIRAVAKLNWLENFFAEMNRKQSDAGRGEYAERLKRLLFGLDGEYFQITCFDSLQRPIAKVQLASFFSRELLPVHFEAVYYDEQDRIGAKESVSLSKNEIYISEAKNIRGSKALVLAVRVFDSKLEQAIGTMTFSLPVPKIAESAIKRFSLGIAGQVMVVDKRGELIYHTDRKKINQNLQAAMPSLEPVLAPMLSLKKGTARYKLEDDEAWIISYAPLKKVQWSVAVASPIKPFIQSTEQAGLIGVIVTLGISVLLLFLISRFSRKFVRDLSEVTEGARALAAGDLDRKIPVRTNDEIGELAADFNIMAADLKQHIHERQANETLIAVGKFSAALAHDLRNPVEGLKLLSRELGKRVDPQRPEHEIADTIVQSVDRLSSLVNQSLDFARLNQPVFGETDLTALADEVLQDFRFGDVELKKDYAHCLPPVEVDAAQIKRVLANLLRNALEACYSKSGSARCQIRLTLQADREKVHLEVTDTGPGISAEIREKIFDPFFSTKPGGHGLGLALARQIISNHGGTIAFASEMGQGTRFVIELPIKKHL